MKSLIATYVIAGCTLLTGVVASFDAHAVIEASAASMISALPVASVIASASDVGGAAMAIPLTLSVAGSTLLVKAVEASARGVVCVLERASDGARASVEIAGRGLQIASVVAGAVVTVSVVGTGTMLSTAGQVIAFIPNELGRSLLHNERVTP